MTEVLHFKDYNLAVEKIREVNAISVNYYVETHLTMSNQKGLIVTITTDEINLEEHLQLIKSFGLETY